MQESVDIPYAINYRLGTLFHFVPCIRALSLRSTLMGPTFFNNLQAPSHSESTQNKPNTIEMCHRYNYSNYAKHLSKLATTSVNSAYANLLLDLINNRINSRPWQMLPIFGFVYLFWREKIGTRNKNLSISSVTRHVSMVDFNTISLLSLSSLTREAKLSVDFAKWWKF